MIDGWSIELLAQHDRQSFDCGVASLNDFLKIHARQNADADISRTFVAIQRPSSRVLGFYTICSGSVERITFPPSASKGLPRYPIPIVHLARLAVDVSYQRQKRGSDLVVDALRRIIRLAIELGIRAVTVDALDDRASQFYLRFGFEPLLDNKLHLFLPLATIRKLDF